LGATRTRLPQRVRETYLDRGRTLEKALGASINNNSSDMQRRNKSRLRFAL